MPEINTDPELLESLRLAVEADVYRGSMASLAPVLVAEIRRLRAENAKLHAKIASTVTLRFDNWTDPWVVTTTD